MAEFPFTIEAVNRFRPKAEIRDVLKRTAAGAVDILIGTHRILQKDVAFKDLGLVIIDEEQRFGVEDKEWLKTLPLDGRRPDPLGHADPAHPAHEPAGHPRHLQPGDAAAGPQGDRDPRDPLRRRDHQAGHPPRAQPRRPGLSSSTTGSTTSRPSPTRSSRSSPRRGSRSATARWAASSSSGRCSPSSSRKYDILVATTIIESGLDIPNVNTIFINEADKYGLADLHQLRGRVGRYKHRAYAYLLLESDKSVTPNAVKRLKAIEEFTELGAGFKIALRDLEIRGAGNILGAEQSGHIESVGYELYCSLLESAARALTNQPEKPLFDCSVELGWRAYFPRDYVPAPRVKLELYRRLGRLRTLNHLADFRKELIDRFGPLPRPAENLLVEAEIRILAGAWKLDRIHVETGQYVVLTYGDSARIEALARRHPRQVRIVDAEEGVRPSRRRPRQDPRNRRDHTDPAADVGLSGGNG